MRESYFANLYHKDFWVAERLVANLIQKSAQHMYIISIFMAH